MKLSSYINEAHLDIMSMEEFNEVIDELEAVGEANKAQSRLASLEALNADTNSVQYRLAMETILTPVGLGDNENITAEDLKEIIADVGVRLRDKIISILNAIHDRFDKIYDGLKAMLSATPPDIDFLRNWKNIVRRNSPDTAQAVVTELEEKLKPIIHIPHRNAYVDNKLGSGLLKGGIEADLAFTLFKITDDGENKSIVTAKAETVVPHNLPEVIEALSKACQDGKNWVLTFEMGTRMIDIKDEQIKRLQASVVAVAADAKLVTKAQADITPIYTAFGAAAKKYGDN